jgi:TP901 family phage tail tape measure protein
MANQVVNRTVNIFIQSGDAQRVYDQLIAKQKKLTDQLAQNPKDAAKIRQELERLEEPIARAAKKLSGELEPSLRDTKASASKLGRELSLMSESDPGFKEKVLMYQQANRELETQRGKVGLLSKAWKSFWTEAKTVAVGVLIGNTVQNMLQTVMGYVSGMVTGSAKIADELSDIEKTTNLTKSQVLEINKELSKLDTRTSSSQLRQLAVEAGKLGKESVQDVVKFVDEADKINVALGEDLGEGAITALGKLSKIFKVDMLNIGSAINEIGANSEASESFAVDFLNRLAGTGPAVKVSAADLLGYGAALEIAGQTAEVSGTSLSNFFIDFVRDSEKFGKAAGFAKGELTDLINTKGTNAAFIEFLTRLKEANPDAQQFLGKMQELGVDGSRGANVMLALSNNIKSVKDQQLIANNAIQSNSSIMTEFNKKNNNAAAELDKLKKNFASLFASDTIREGGAAAVRVLNNLVNILKSSFQFFSDHKVLLLSLSAAYVFLTTSMEGATLATIRNRVVTQAKLALDALEASITRIRTAALILYGNAANLVAGRITLAMFAQRAWNAVMALGAGPIGILLVAIGVAVIGIEKLINRTKELSTAQKLAADVAQRVAEATGETVTRVQLLEGVLKNENIQYDQKKKALEELIKINPDFANTLKLNKDGTVEGTKAIGDYITALKAQAEAQAKFELFVEKTKQRAALINKFRAQTPGAETLTDDQLIEKGRTAADQIGKSGFQLKGDFSTFIDLTREIDTLSQNMDQLQKTAANAGNGLKEGLTENADKAGDSINSLRKKLEGLQALRDAATGDKDTKDDKGNINLGRDSLNKQIGDIEKAIDKMQGKVTKGAKKSGDDLKSLQEELKQLATSLLPDDTLQQKFDKELTTLDDKYNKFREKAHGNNKLLLEIENLYQLERQNLVDKFRKEQEKNLDEAFHSELERMHAQEKKRQQFAEQMQPLLDRTVQKNLDQLARLDRDVEARHELELIKAHGRQKLQAELQILDDQEKQELSKKDLTENEKALIEEKFRKKRADADNNYWAGLINNIANWAQKGSDLISVFDQIRTNKENGALAKDKAINDKKKENLDKRLKQGLISQEQHDKAVERLNKQQEGKEKEARLKQFKRDQRAAYVNASIDGLRAVSKTLAEFGPPVPPNFLGIAAMAFTLISTAAQLKLISSREPPQFGRGGKTGGRPHSQGGNPILDGYSGRKIGEIEEDEGIINKFSMRDNTRYKASGTISQIASALNARHGGVHWESGATLVPSWKTYKPQPMNFAVIRQAQRYAAGGQFQNQAVTASPASPGDDHAMANILLSLAASVENLNAQLAAGIVAKTYITDQEAQQERLDNIRNDATFKP